MPVWTPRYFAQTTHTSSITAYKLYCQPIPLFRFEFSKFPSGVSAWTGIRFITVVWFKAIFQHSLGERVKKITEIFVQGIRYPVEILTGCFPNTTSVSVSTKTAKAAWTSNRWTWKPEGGLFACLLYCVITRGKLTRIRLYFDRKDMLKLVIWASVLRWECCA
jgi:hypothetical protein